MKSVMVAATGLVVVGAVAAAAAVVGPKGTAADFAARSITRVSSSSQYSVTQTVVNNSAETLTLDGTPTVDNGGSVQSGYPTTIDPNGGTGTFKATNTGNGVQLWLNFTGSNGAKISVDTDTPKKDVNWTKGQVTANGSVASAVTLTTGDNPTASFTVGSSTTQGTQTTSVYYDAAGKWIWV